MPGLEGGGTQGSYKHSRTREKRDELINEARSQRTERNKAEMTCTIKHVSRQCVGGKKLPGIESAMILERASLDKKASKNMPLNWKT